MEFETGGLQIDMSNVPGNWCCFGRKCWCEYCFVDEVFLAIILFSNVSIFDTKMSLNL